MNYKIYKTPDPSNRLDTSLRYEKGIVDLLLRFDESIHNREGIQKIVTAPAQNKIGFNVVACQTFFGKYGKAAYVFHPETGDLYSFTEVFFPIREASRRFLKAGLKGLVFGAEEKGILWQMVQEYDYDHVILSISAQEVPQEEWYHFTGSAENVLEELKKRSKGFRSR